MVRFDMEYTPSRAVGWHTLDLLVGNVGGKFWKAEPSGGRIALEVSFVVEQPGSLSCSLSASWKPGAPHTYVTMLF